MKRINWSQLIICILIPEAVGLVSALLSGNNSSIYRSLIMPPLAPPGWLFGVVWPVLFALMGIATYLILNSPKASTNQDALILYYAQLAVNFSWSIIFFRFQLYWPAVIVILLLLVLIYLNYRAYSRISKIAGLLLLPYLMWVLFATYLNIGFAILN